MKTKHKKKPKTYFRRSVGGMGLSSARLNASSKRSGGSGAGDDSTVQDESMDGEDPAI